MRSLPRTRPGLVAAVVAIGLIGAPVAPASAGGAGANGAGTRGPGAARVTERNALHHDASPPLRDMRAIRPPRAQVFVPRRGVPAVQPAGAASGHRPLDQAVQPVAPGVVPPVHTSFEGLANVDGVYPPDSEGDVGPGEYVQWINSSFAIFDKSGHRLFGPAEGNTLWQGFGGVCQKENQGDPIVLYDPLADRWVMSQFAFNVDQHGHELPPFVECVAVSQTPDPMGKWFRYSFQISDVLFDDYPKMGVWPDGYYLTFNMIRPLTGEFVGVELMALDRTNMLEGLDADSQSVDMWRAFPQQDLVGLMPSDLDGQTPPPDGSPNYVLALQDKALDRHVFNDRLEIFRFHADFAHPLRAGVTGPVKLRTTPFDADMCGGSFKCIPQPGTPRRVDAIAEDQLMFRGAYRNFGDHQSIVVNATVDVNGHDHAGVRWFEIRDPGGHPVLFQEGTEAPDGADRWMGSAAMDAAGDIALGYNAAGKHLAPSIRYTGRTPLDPPGSMEHERTLQAGGGSQTGTSRWGDYSTMSVDPADDCTFWYQAEYLPRRSPTGWHTRIGSFKFPGCPAS
ncbi:MAG: hypothetical protein M3Q23_08545 [Actinomycetota bacterium]|nr:hypothetical protein [Actinomycetota bacterium]